MSVVAAAENKDEPPIDWSKPVVSRGFGLGLEENSQADLQQAFKAGQVSYYFGDYKAAFEHWEDLAKKGYAAAQANIGWMYQAGLGLPKDISQAIYWYMEAARQGHAVAQNNLGVLYENGQGLKRDLGHAFDLYRQSAMQGYRFAQYNLANMYLEGKGTEQNLQEARSWLNKASEQGVDAAAKALEKLGKDNGPGE